MEEAASRLSLQEEPSHSSPSSSNKPEPVAPPPTPVEPAGPVSVGNGQAGSVAGSGEVGGVSTASILSSLLEIHVEPAAPKPEPSAQVSSTPAPTPVRRAPSVRSGATTILDSLQEIDLDNDEAPPSLAPGQGLVSASRTLMELKAVEKQRSEMNAVAPVPTRRMMAGPTGMPALDQALDRHGDEANRLAVFDRLQKVSSTSGGGRKAQLSRSAKARKSKGTEKEQAYTDRLCGRVVKTNKRKERMDRLKNLY